MKTKLIAAALALLSFAMFGSLAVAQEDAFQKGSAALLQEDYVEAVKWYRLSAEQGDAKAQFALGALYTHGAGVPQNDTEAMKWYRLSAKQGLAEAQYSLGVMYANGEGVPENDTEAVKWYRLAADKGDAMAQSNLGVMYLQGRGVPEDFVQAYKWFNLAAAQGDQTAADNKEIARNLMTPQQIAEAQKLSSAWKPVGER